MAYEKRTWECGDILTPEAMNHIEQGIADASKGGSGGTTAPLIANLSGDLRDASCENVAVVDKTFNEISEAYLSGQNVLFNDPMGSLLMVTMVNSQTKSACVFDLNDEGVATIYMFFTAEDGKMYYPHCEILE